MHRNSHRLVFSRLRGMLVAVEETAAATGKSTGETNANHDAWVAQETNASLCRFIIAPLLLAVAPLLSFAQIVPGGSHAPGVVTTQNGIPQVNINKPAGSGVSVNTYSQFDIQKNGAILNNSPTIVNTQQAGYINGNPNFGPNDAARVIVNQVNGNSPSQLRGYLEVAGKNAQVVIANPNGLMVDGGGFINTSRATLTTGTPNFAADGSLSGFNVTGGNITVQGAGFNGSNIDQVDLLARAVQINAAIYAKNLNVVTGSNAVDYNTLFATPVAGNGAAPGVSIDVSNLGGMYANRIVLVGTENGVGVSNKGVLAAQSGDLILTTQGKLVLAGQTNASGNITASARDGIDNSGTTYAQQSVSTNTSGALTNSGTLAAQQNLTIDAGSVASTGTLGAGVNGDGTIAGSGDLSVTATGAVTATGRNAAGGNATLKGSTVDLAASNTSAKGALTLTASSGNLNLSGATAAGADLHVTGSDLIAAKNITGTGANVTIDAATNAAHHDETQEVSKSGFTLAVKAPEIDAISNTVDQARAASRSQDDRASALHGMAAASGALDSIGAVGGAMSELANGQTPSAKIELSYGSSHSKSTFTEDSTSNRGSSVTAGGTAAFVATGNSTAGSGNVTIAGSNVNANDVILAAKNQINLVNTTDTDSTRSTNQSSSASVGVSYGTQGFGVSASMAKAHGDANSDATMQNNTHVTATNTATIISGGDTNIIGANVNGRQVNADVGGNLNIASAQDTMTSAAHQSSTGGGFSISQGGGSASFSHSSGSASGSYAGVNEQAGIHAGDGGFNINVKGNTDLKGATIASDADASKNNLSTGTLTYADIQNQSSYNAHSSGFSGGVTTGDGGSNYTTHGPTSRKNAGGGAPMLSQNDSGSDSATTRSGISASTINVTDSAHQMQDAASLNRDTANTNGTVAKLPDVNNLLDKQADMMAAASAAGEAVSRRVGDFADSKYKEAEKAGDQAGMDAWKEGGTARAEIQAAGAAIVTGLAGGNALGGAAGAGIASMAAGKLNELSGAIASSNPTGNEGMNEALGNIVANAVATAAGGAVGGNAGAFSGYDVDRYNRQLHPQEKTLAKQLAEKAKADGLKNPDGSSITAAQIEDQMRIMGGSFDASRESGSAVTLIGEMPTDSGARWLAAPETSDGKPVLTQITAQPNLGLQNYIATNAGSVSAGDVPSIVYDPTAKGGGVNVTGPFAKLDKSDVDYVRETTANVAGFAGTQFDRTSAMATALASAGLPFPFVSTSAEAIAVSASFVSWAAGGIQQLAKPDAGNYAVANLISQMTGKAMGTYPFAAPVINEVGNLISNSGVAQSAQDWVNSKWPTSNKK